MAIPDWRVISQRKDMFIYERIYGYPSADEIKEDLYILIFQMIKAVLIVALLVFASTSQEETGVLQLTGETFHQAIQDHPFLFVKFYTPWCGHCKKLAPIFVELAEKLKEITPKIQLADIDLDTHKEIQTEFNINGFPTLILFHNGKQIKFGGARNLEFMLFWLTKRTKQPLIPITPEELPSLESDGYVNIVFRGDLSSPKAAILSKLSETDDYNMYYQVKASTSTESVEIFRPFGKSISSDKIDSGIRNWIGLFDRPFVYPFDDRASGEIFSDKRNAVFFFLPEGEVGEKARMELFALAFDWKIQLKRRLIFTELRRTDEQFSGLAEYFKIDPDQHFLVYVKTAEKLKYLYSGSPLEANKQKLAQFIKSVQGSKIKPFKLEQETRPAAPKKPEAVDEL